MMDDEEARRARAAVEGPDPLDLAFEYEGITTEYLAKKLKAELEATKTEFAKHKGELGESVDLIDWQTRQRARMDAHRLKGHYPADRVDLRGHLEGGGNWTIEVVDARDKDEGSDES